MFLLGSVEKNANCWKAWGHSVSNLLDIPLNVSQILFVLLLLSWPMPSSPHITDKNNLIQCANFSMEESDLLQLIVRKDAFCSLFMNDFQVLLKVEMESSSISKHFFALVFLASFVVRKALWLGCSQCNLVGILLVEYGKMLAFFYKKDRCKLYFPSPFFSALNVNLIPNAVVEAILQP